MSQRFTVDGSPELEQRLERECVAFTQDVQRIVPENILEAVVLGGGYGRGEGGVVQTAKGDDPYNDLEFYIFVRGPLLWRERQFRAPLHELTHRWSAQAGIEFEAKLLTFEKIQDSPVTMFYHDLVVGHRWVWGQSQSFENCQHHLAAHRIPLHEATRLLMNRASGLLFSRALLEQPEFKQADADFVRRNISKAQLAMGDVVLTAFGKYHGSCRERNRRLEKMEPATEGPWLSDVLANHETGVQFKLHPYISNESREVLREEHAKVTDLAGKIFLWLERRRLSASFDSHRDYAFDQRPKHPDTRAVRNALVSGRALGARGISRRYPRERLLNSLALLLWTPESLTDFACLRKVQTELLTNEATLSRLIEPYRRIWNRFN